MRRTSHEHAVVLGASMSGLLAARVLSDFYDNVTLVDRDTFAGCATNRRGVPQGRHVHILMRRGSQILAELFPGILDELVTDGAAVWNNGDLTRIDLTFTGHRLTRTGRFTDRAATAVYSASRPLLEFRVRRRVQDLPNVDFVENCDVVGLTATTTCDDVTGVIMHDRDINKSRTLDAGLVVDATGRGSRAPTFLRELGYDAPQEDVIAVRVAYSSQLFQLPPDALPLVLLNNSATVDRQAAVAMCQCENNTFLLTGVGVGGLEPPVDCAGLLDFAEKLAPEPIATLRTGKAIGELSQYRYPSNRWRRFDKLRQMPQGFLVTGDALCSFNPTYGQGMTVAAMDALALQRCLRSGYRDLARRFFAAASKGVQIAWRMGTAADLALPGVDGDLTTSMRMTNAYLDWLLSAAETHADVAEQFFKVINMTADPTDLFHPRLVRSLASAHLRRLTGNHRSAA